jgi:hypothetical protein
MSTLDTNDNDKSISPRKSKRKFEEAIENDCPAQSQGLPHKRYYQYITVDQVTQIVQEAISEQTSLLWTEILYMKMEIERLQRASLPEPSSTNPIAALINFGKHQLLIDVEFKHIEFHDTDLHIVEVYFLDQLMGAGADRRKKVAGEIAAKEVLKKLNNEHQLLDRFIDLALKQQLHGLDTNDNDKSISPRKSKRKFEEAIENDCPAQSQGLPPKRYYQYITVDQVTQIVQEAISEQTSLLCEILYMKMEIERLQRTLDESNRVDTPAITYTENIEYGYAAGRESKIAVFQIDTVGTGVAKADDVKRRSKIIASLPEPSSTNPIAALINFGKHQLLIDVEFKHIEKHDTNLHIVEVYFLDQLMGAGADRRKKVAREIAAKEVLIKLNNEHQLLDRFIDLALKQQKVWQKTHRVGAGRAADLLKLLGIGCEGNLEN